MQSHCTYTASSILQTHITNVFSHLALYILHTHSFHPFLLVFFSLPSLLPVLIFPLTYDRAPPKMPSTRSFLTFSLLALSSPLLISAIPQGYEYPAPPPSNPNPASPYTHSSLPPESYIPILWLNRRVTALLQRMRIPRNHQHLLLVPTKTATNLSTTQIQKITFLLWQMSILPVCLFLPSKATFSLLPLIHKPMPPLHHPRIQNLTAHHLCIRLHQSTAHHHHMETLFQRCQLCRPRRLAIQFQNVAKR